MASDAIDRPVIFRTTVLAARVLRKGAEHELATWKNYSGTSRLCHRAKIGPCFCAAWMASGSSLIANFLELLDIHRSICCRWHLDKVAEQRRDVEAGETRLCPRAHLEFANFLPRPLVAVLFGYTGAVRPFRFFECVFADIRGQLINFHAG